MANLSYVLRTVKEVKTNPPSAIKAELDSSVQQLSSTQATLASKSEVKSSEKGLRSELTFTTQQLQDKQASLASKSDVEQFKRGVTCDLMDTQDNLKEAKQSATSAGVKSNQALRNSMEAHQQIRAAQGELETRINTTNTYARIMSLALCGNIELHLDDDSVEEITQAEIQAGCTRLLILSLAAKEPSGEDFLYTPHSWFTGEPAVTLEHADVPEPTVHPEDDPTADPNLVRGVGRWTVTFPAGTYAVDKVVLVKPKIDATATRPWAAAEVTKTFKVVA